MFVLVLVETSGCVNFFNWFCLNWTFDKNQQMNQLKLEEETFSLKPNS